MLRKHSLWSQLTDILIGVGITALEPIGDWDAITEMSIDAEITRCTQFIAPPFLITRN